MSDMIVVAGLTKTYRQSGGAAKLAVDNISFSVRTGEIFGLLGPNGAGKTTTLEMIETLTAPTSGQIHVLGYSVETQPNQVRESLGVQLQSSSFPPRETLGETLTLFASFYRRQVNVLDILERVNLSEQVNLFPSQLSGGQRQRFAIAVALVHEPPVIFLDEPTTALDPRARRDMWQLIQSLNQAGKTIVLTTHNMEEAEFLCHRVAIMDQGRILHIDEPKTLIDRLAHTTQASFLVHSRRDESFWSSLPGVTQVYDNFPKIVLELSGLDQVSSLVSHLHTQGISFSGFTVKTASLEDVYLDLTGREYQV